MVNCCFIILHYKNDKDTMQCIDSILALRDSSCKILVLDNGSCDGSYERLQSYYKTKSDILLYKWEKAQGFSHGNNFLYKEAKKLSPDFIIAANNDIVFDDEYFCIKLRTIYESDFFDILGPDICILKNNEHQNPLAPYLPKRSYLETEIEEQRKIKKHIYRYVLIEWVLLMEKRLIARFSQKGQNTYYKIRNFLKPTQKNRHWNRDYLNAQKQCILCGACLILSPHFINNNEKIFVPETNFYYEEYILGIRCKKEQMVMCYDPSLKVIHNHGSSTQYAYSGLLDRRRFVTDNMVKSGELLLSILEDDNTI